MSNLRLTARERSARLSYAETVRIGRAVQQATACSTNYPDGTPTPVVVIRGFEGELPEQTRLVVEEVLGPFDAAPGAD